LLGIIGIHPILEWNVSINFSKLKFHCFYWTNSYHPCVCSHNWQRIDPFRSYPHTTLTSIQWKLEEKWYVICSSITNETFSRLASFWIPFPYCFKIFPTRKCSPHRRHMFTSSKTHNLIHMFAFCIMGK
jgi:hypothetical protein